LIVDQQDISFLDRPNSEAFYVAGTWKISIRVFVRLQDTISGLNVSKAVKPTALSANVEISKLRDQVDKLSSRLTSVLNLPPIQEEDEKEAKNDNLK
jgi:hypothetical protein